MILSREVISRRDRNDAAWRGHPALQRSGGRTAVRTAAFGGAITSLVAVLLGVLSTPLPSAAAVLAGVSWPVSRRWGRVAGLAAAWAGFLWFALVLAGSTTPGHVRWMLGVLAGGVAAALAARGRG